LDKKPQKTCGSQPAVDIETNEDFAISLLPPLPNFGEKAVFCGHLKPDCDSVASAIAGASMFNGVAAMTAPLNKEAKYLLARFNIEEPALVAEVYNPGQGFVLVDHNAQAQMHPVLLEDSSELRGIFDHHPFTATSASMSVATFVETNNWGSCTTIMATKFLQYGIPMSPSMAGLLLGAIVSDTLNFKSPTTTEHDRKVGGWLARQVDWEQAGSSNKHKIGRTSPAIRGGHSVVGKKRKVDYAVEITELARGQFQAKANLTDLTFTEITLLDFKQQSMPNGDMVGWGQCETVDPFYSEYLTTASLLGFVEAMRAERSRQGLEYIFVSFVDIWSPQVGKDPRSTVVCISEEECSVLRAAFPGGAVSAIAGASEGASIVDTSPRVSRKSQFIPAISAVLK
jgi:manganese-dependent inorganic pyrophosphatase